MGHWLWIILAALFFECKGEDRVIQTTAEVFTTEGQTLTLDCIFQTSRASPTLFWYKQEASDFPKFMLKCFSDKVEKSQEFQTDRFDATMNKTSVSLKIQELQLSDSAVYYCALQPTTGNRKLIFGDGIMLNVEFIEEYQPSYYKLSENDTTACLATGFSRDKATKEFEIFNKTEAVRIDGDGLYNEVSLMKGNEECPISEESGSCQESLKPDETVNLAGLTILGLRLLFFKTVIFNVLMTLRLWLSH